MVKDVPILKSTIQRVYRHRLLEPTVIPKRPVRSPSHDDMGRDLAAQHFRRAILCARHQEIDRTIANTWGHGFLRCKPPLRQYRHAPLPLRT